MLYSLTAVVVLVVAVVLFAVKIVPLGVEVPVERWGRFIRMARPGVHVLLPFVDRLRTPVSTREETLRTPERPFTTADGQVQLLVSALTWRVTDTRAAAYEIADYRAGVEQLLMTVLRTSVSARDRADGWARSEETGREAERVLIDACRPWGVTVERLQIEGWQRE